MKINTICFLQFFSLLPYFFYIFTKTLFFFWVTKWICHCEYSSWSVCTFNLFNGWMLADTKEVAILFMMVIGVMLPQFFLQGNCHYLHQSAGHVVRLWSERLVQIRLIWTSDTDHELPVQSFLWSCDIYALLHLNQ